MLRPSLRDALLATPPSSDQCQQIARWQQGLGQARQAARWWRWSLTLPPDPLWRKALAELWLDLGEPQHAQALLAAAEAQDIAPWLELELLIKEHQLEPALALQAKLLHDAHGLPPQRLLAIAERWQSLQEHAAALALLLSFEQQQTAAGHDPGERLCNAIAALFEQQGKHEAASEWWTRSLAAAPQQPAVQMRVARQLVRAGQPHAALGHLAAVLQAHAQHRWALQLQLEILLNLQAPRSARIAYQALTKVHDGESMQAWRHKLQKLEATSMTASLPPPSRIRLQQAVQIVVWGGAQLQWPRETLPQSGGRVDLVKSAEPLSLSLELSQQLGSSWIVQSCSAWPERLEPEALLLWCQAATEVTPPLPASWQHTPFISLRWCSEAGAWIDAT